MNKKLFIASSLSKPSDKNKECVVLDNFIALNNNDIKYEKLHDCPRNSKEDWLRYEKEIVSRYDKYIEILSKRLDYIHGNENDIKYWKQLFYRGLKRYITLVYEFYDQVENRFEPENHSFNLLEKTSFYTPHDFEDLRAYLSDSDISHEQLFTIYVEKFYFNLIDDDKQYCKHQKYIAPPVISEQSLLRKIIYFIYNNFYLLKPKIILLGVGYEKSKIYNLILKSKFKIFVHFIKPFYSTNLEIDKTSRKYLFADEVNFDKFDKFFFKTLETLFPTLYNEDYKCSASYYDKQVERFPKAKYIISEFWISDSSMSFFIAQLKKKNNALFINSEHRGLTHIFERGGFEETLDLSDRYFTIGWYQKSLDKDLKLIVTGHLNVPAINNKNIERYKGKILYMAAPINAKRTNYFNIDFFMGEDSRCVFAFQEIFFSNLGVEILQSIVYRMAPILKKWSVLTYNQVDILNSYVKHMEMDNFDCNGLEAMQSAKIVVIDYIGSGYLDALVYNIPTIILLCDNAYLSDEGLELFQELVDINVVHKNALEAADFLMSVENDPLKWWRSEGVQKARKSFLHKTIGGACVLENKILDLL
jgi:putative transferase (TIGR04331 family)